MLCTMQSPGECLWLRQGEASAIMKFIVYKGTWSIIIITHKISARKGYRRRFIVRLGEHSQNPGIQNRFPEKNSI